MKENLKQLLLVDLCARLPYGVKVRYKSVESEGDIKLGYGNIGYIPELGRGWWIECKPYLRPMSSMTEEEREDFWWNVLDMDWKEDLDYDELETVPFPFVENSCGVYLDNYYLRDTFAVIDWLNEHHFDYRGLSDKGLAIEVTEDNNPYKE